MTRKVFWEDPYLTSLETRVAGVDGAEVTLEETIFYALSGGQESDAGAIAGRPVLEARKDGREIIYTLAQGHGLAAGEPVTVTIDWDRRYRLMRLHFAAELVLELCYRKLKGAEKIGAHISPDKARLDFLWGQSVSPLLADIRAEAMKLIEADLPVISAFSDRASERRYWKVDGFAQVPCGGTHLRRTGEVGRIALKRNNIGKGKERVDIFLA